MEDLCIEIRQVFTAFRAAAKGSLKFYRVNQTSPALSYPRRSVTYIPFTLYFADSPSMSLRCSSSSSCPGDESTAAEVKSDTKSLKGNPYPRD